MHVLLVAAMLAVNAAQADTSCLYRTHLVRAAPGRLLDLIDAYMGRMSVYEAAGEFPPIVMRHSQGDHWDLMLMFPMGSFAEYYSADRVATRERAAAQSGVTEAEFRRMLDPLVSWQEDVYVLGPAIETLSAVMSTGRYFHAEMLVSLPGRRDALFHEREMENVYQAAIGRPVRMIFTRVAGASWDCFTIGIYRDLQHFAENDVLSPEQRHAAAVAAGFESPERIGIYMRSLILSHNDTHGSVITRR